MQDSGTMPLIAEVLLAVSVGCVEIRQAKPPRANEPIHIEGDEMDSYQVHTHYLYTVSIKHVNECMLYNILKNNILCYIT